MKARTFKTTSNRKYKISKQGSAIDALGKLEHGQDTFVLTFGQFSLINALMVILDQIGPADVTISTWTSGIKDSNEAAELLENGSIKKLQFIVDRSFKTRQPEYCEAMRKRFGDSCIRAFRTHAKFMLIRNDEWNIVVRTSMNLNENRRLENLEVTDNLEFAEFFQLVVDDIFNEVEEGEYKSTPLSINSIQEELPFMEIEAKKIDRSTLNEPTYSHTIKEL